MRSKLGGGRSVNQPLGSTQHGLWLVSEDLRDGAEQFEFYAQVPSSQSV